MQPLFALAFLSWISIGKLNHILRLKVSRGFFPRFLFLLMQFWICFDINTRIITTENIKKKGLDN